MARRKYYNVRDVTGKFAASGSKGAKKRRRKKVAKFLKNNAGTIYAGGLLGVAALLNAKQPRGR